MIVAYDLYNLEYEKREELQRISYECMEISKKYKIAVIEEANKVPKTNIMINPSLQKDTTFRNKYLKYKEKYLLLKSKLNEY